MEIKSFDYNEECGFAWILVDTNKDEGEWAVQCCLTDGEIIMNDCGHDQGICSDVNEEAFNYWGENRCMTALFRAAEKEGLAVKAA